MYTSFYGLAEQPFNLTPDSKFLYQSHRHQEALASLLFGVQERKGFICLSGEIGSGKTTLVRTLLAQLDREQTRTAVILNSYLNDLELLKTINEEFGLPAHSDSKKALLDELNRFLVEQFHSGHNVVLIIDEAQNLRPETLEQIRMISNLETETEKLVQIILVGQPELRQTLALPELEQLNQRITVRYHVTPLNEAEVGEYIFHRLRVAKAQINIQFSPQALRMIFHFSDGVPRRVNVICDRCLLVGYVLGRYDIDGDMVQQAVDEVRGEQKYESMPAPVTEAASRSWGRRAGRFALAGTGLAAVAFLGIWLGAGLKMMTDRGDDGLSLSAAASRPTPEPQLSPAPSPSPVPVLTATPEPTPEATPVASPTPEPTATPEPTPTPAPPAPLSWAFDKDKVLRVSKPEHATAAAYLTLLGAWGIEVDPSTFAEASPAEIGRFDLSAMIRQLDFHTFSSDALGDAIKLDLPMLARLNADGADRSPVVTILRMQGDLFTVADPIHGMKTLRRAELEPHVLSLTIPYRDPKGLTGLERGSEGPAVVQLQEILTAQGATVGPADGKFGPKLADILANFQQQHGLQATGKVNPATAVYLAALLDPKRPRLFS